MSIKLKEGACKDCGKKGPLIAQRCQSCYWGHRGRVSASKPKAISKKVQKKVLGTFFASQALIMPSKCEECGSRLPTSPEWMRRACIAHILKKRGDFGFPSVAIHPQNKMFFCPDCHYNMDNLGERYILKMKSLPVMRQRVSELLPLLTDQELNRVPQYFL